MDKADNDVEGASSSSNDDSEEDADADIEESPRGRKSVSSIIEMAIKTEQEAAKANNINKAKTQKEDEQKAQELSRLPPPALAIYLEELEAELYELSQREARELSRSKQLRIFGSNRRRPSK
ncbi:uncharacterized protein LOC133843830 [Drosophila sulfurigaster albostrigata]|uniref:uncharacterized protein LOC133843830 n=1 Tax=Drosophila sulfurigaster albostrigata TaxID=89887 RepID=UPI002D218C93|nr:uncharacterized protein LOC133843830 [Drosophila sulfurigaster albostrigata]